MEGNISQFLYHSMFTISAGVKLVLMINIELIASHLTGYWYLFVLADRPWLTITSISFSLYVSFSNVIIFIIFITIVTIIIIVNIILSFFFLFEKQYKNLLK